MKSYDGLESLDVNVTGTVVPYRHVTLGAEIAGRVQFKSEDCRIGRFVHKGDVLFNIDPTDFKLEVDRLAALRDSEYAHQKELDQELANAKKSLLLSEEDFALQEKELKRLESLPNGIASAAELDQSRRQRISSANQRLLIQNQMQISCGGRMSKFQAVNSKAMVKRSFFGERTNERLASRSQRCL